MSFRSTEIITYKDQQDCFDFRRRQQTSAKETSKPGGVEREGEKVGPMMLSPTDKRYTITRSMDKT